MKLQQAGSGFVWRTIQLGGTKAIFLVRLLILARLLTPADFGLVTIAASAIGFLMSVTNFGMVEALVQGEEESEARYNAAWTINVSRALIVSAGVFLAAPLVATIFSTPESTNVIRVLAFQPLLDALASIKVAGLTRGLHFRPLTMLQLSRAVVNTIVSIVVSIQFGVWGLVVGTLAGSTTFIVISYLVAPHRPRLLFSRELARPLLQFGRWIYATSLVMMIGTNILKIAISRQLGAAELGLYYLATQIAFLPYEVSAEVIGSVAFPLYARMQTNLRMAAQTFRTIFSGTAAILYPFCALIMVLAPTLVEEILGPKWAGTAPMILVLTMASAIGLFSDSAVPIFLGLGQPYRFTVVEFVQSTILIVFVWELAGRFGVVGAAAAWLPAIIASQIVAVIFMQRMLDRPFNGLKRPMLAIILASCFGAIVAFGLDFVAPGIVGFLLAGTMGLVVTVLMLWLLDRRLDLGFVRNFALFFPQIAGRIRLVHTETGSASA